MIYLSWWSGGSLSEMSCKWRTNIELRPARNPDLAQSKAFWGTSSVRLATTHW